MLHRAARRFFSSTSLKQILIDDVIPAQRESTHLTTQNS